MIWFQDVVHRAKHFTVHLLLFKSLPGAGKVPRKQNIKLGTHFTYMCVNKITMSINKRKIFTIKRHDVTYT